MINRKNSNKVSFVKESLLVYILWLAGQILANSLLRFPETQRIGGFIYFGAVITTGIIVPYVLMSKRGIKVKFGYKSWSIKGLISSLILIVIMFVFGIQALDDYGMDLKNIGDYSLAYHVRFIPHFLVTMIAYCFLWFGYFYKCIRYTLKGKKGCNWISIFVSAAFYSIYHFTSMIDQYSSWNELYSTMFFTFIIGILTGVHQLFSKSSVGTLIAMYVINFFVFLPFENYHPEGWESIEGPLILFIVCGAIFLLKLNKTDSEVNI